MAGKYRANTQRREAGQEERLEDLEAQPPAAAYAAPAPAPAAAGPSDDAIAS